MSDRLQLSVPGSANPLCRAKVLGEAGGALIVQCLNHFDVPVGPPTAIPLNRITTVEVIR